MKIDNIEEIAKALYVINKQAKYYRDKAYYSDRIGNREKRDDMYHIKNKVMDKLISEYNIKPVGYHTFSKADEVLDYYEIAGYGFHYDHLFDDLDDLGSIDSYISAHKNEVDLTAEQAYRILHLFLYDDNYCPDYLKERIEYSWNCNNIRITKINPDVNDFEEEEKIITLSINQDYVDIYSPKPSFSEAFFDSYDEALIECRNDTIEELQEKLQISSDKVSMLDDVVGSIMDRADYYLDDEWNN